MHGSEHAGDKTIDTPAFFDKRYQGRYATFVVRGVTEVSEYHLLERVDLVLKIHKVGDGFVT